MTDKELTPTTHSGVDIQPIEQEIQTSYINYAMSVIVSRALPDARDGLKPVLRRILYAMYDMNLTADNKFSKCAKVVGEVLGKYHPHGDSSVYEALVRLAQPFQMRYPLIRGQGNFGSVDGDGAAAMRYTEAKLTKLAAEMLFDIEQNTVERKDNYDQSIKEPCVLPTKFPNHLCNGVMGIAVGMATNMPPHNLTEIMDASILLVKNPDATFDEIMEIIKGPDFPTGGVIFDPFNIKMVYEKGRGGILCRGKTHIEQSNHGPVIVIDEIPYSVNKAGLVTKIAELVTDKKIEGIIDLRDESSKNIIRVTITLKKGINIDHILTLLYKYTDLQTTFNINNVVLTENGLQPHVLNIRDMLMEFITFRKLVVLRRSQYQLQKAEERFHILEGLKKAIDNIDEVIETIRKSATKEDAKKNLMQKFDFSDPQSEYILLMRLQSLVGLEIQKIIDEMGEKEKLIAELREIIENPAKLDSVVTKELNYMKKEYGDERRTDVSDDTSVYELVGNLKNIKKLQDMKKEAVITRIGNDLSVRNLYQSRINVIPEDTLEIIHTHNQDKLIGITDIGELVIERIKDIGGHQMKQKGLDIKEHYKLNGNLVFVNTMEHDFQYIVFLTNKNNLKKIKKELLLSFKKFPTIVMGLEPGEKIISIQPVGEKENLGILTQKGMMLLFNQALIRPMGKTAGGVKGIELEEGDSVATMFLYRDEPFILIHSATEGKLVSIEDLKIGKRAQRGLQVVDELGAYDLKGAISIVEGAVRIRTTNATIKTIHSNDINLDDRTGVLDKISQEPIDIIYRPREEKINKKKGEEEEEINEEPTEKITEKE